MSDLDDLAEIAETNCFGFHGIHHPAMGGNRPKEFCAAGHLWTPETTRYRKGSRGRVRICRICVKITDAKSYAKRTANRMRTASEPQ